MLFFALKRMIERGQTKDIEKKIDIFFAADKITLEEYNTLMEMLHPER